MTIVVISNLFRSILFPLSSTKSNNIGIGTNIESERILNRISDRNERISERNKYRNEQISEQNEYWIETNIGTERTERLRNGTNIGSER